jgi:hypothetical protein
MANEEGETGSERKQMRANKFERIEMKTKWQTGLEWQRERERERENKALVI